MCNWSCAECFFCVDWQKLCAHNVLLFVFVFVCVCGVVSGADTGGVATGAVAPPPQAEGT